MRPIKWGGVHGSECSVGGMPPNATFPTEDKKKVRLCEMTVVFSEACEFVAAAFLFLFGTCAFLTLIHF